MTCGRVAFLFPSAHLATLVTVLDHSTELIVFAFCSLYKLGETEAGF